MNHLHLAFLIGLLGSLHCVGMCGPLAFAINSNNENKWLMIIQKLSYNFGRALSYTFVGLLIGLLGKQLWIAGVQQAISIITGIIIVLVSLPKIFTFFNFV